MASLYLQLRAGPVFLMLDASGVHEIVTQDVRRSHDGVDRLHAQWRGSVLPVVVLSSFLGFGESESRVGVVYAPSPDSAPLMLAADEVIGLQQAATHGWRPLPTVPEATADLFDAVYLDPAQPARLAFRLRDDLDAAAFGLAAERLLLEG